MINNKKCSLSRMIYKNSLSNGWNKNYLKLKNIYYLKRSKKKIEQIVY